MGIQKEREEFEKFKAKQIGVNYEALKKDLDDCERRFPNNRYAGWNFKSDWELWQAAKSQAVPEWISVDEQEPECGETVLVCWADALDVDPEMDFMDIDVETGAYYWSNCEADKPTHWMPLPKVIKAQEQSHESD